MEEIEIVSEKVRIGGICHRVKEERKIKEKKSQGGTIYVGAKDRQTNRLENEQRNKREFRGKEIVKGMSGRRTRPGKQVGSGVNFMDGGGTKRQRG